MNTQNNPVFGFTDGENQNSELDQSQSIIDGLTGKEFEPETNSQEEENQSDDENDNIDNDNVDKSNSQDDKDDNQPYHKNSRFQEIRQAKKEIEAKYNEAENRIKELEERLKQTSSKKETFYDDEDENQNQKIDVNALKQELLSELKNQILNKDKIEQEAMGKAEAEFKATIEDMRDDGLDVNEKELAKWVTKLGDLEKARIVYSELLNTQSQTISKSISKKSIEPSSNNKVNKSNPKTYQPGMSWNDITSAFNQYVSK